MIQNGDAITIIEGSGGAVTAAVPSSFYDNADVVVYLVSFDGQDPTETLLSAPADYTITKVPISGTRPVAYSGQITTLNAIAAGAFIVVLLGPINEQTTDFTAIPYDPSLYEKALDDAASRDQRSTEIFKRSPRLALSYQGKQPLISNPDEGRALIWEAGNLVSGPNAADIAAAGEAADRAVAAAEQVEGTAAVRSTSVVSGGAIVNPLTLAFAPTSVDLIEVHIDGVRQHAGNFSVADDQLTFTGGWPAGIDEVEVVIWGTSSITSFEFGVIDGGLY